MQVDPPYFQSSEDIKLKDFHEDRDVYVKRPPYQRKSVWGRGKQKQLIDSFFRRHYVPDIVVREITTPEGRRKKEVVDGQQRITAIQKYFDNEFPLPQSLEDVTDEAGTYYENLSDEVQEYIEERTLTATKIQGIPDPGDKKNQRLTAEIFWRLQQGEQLRYIEEEHSKLYSAVRNFAVKYADNISFDDYTYEPQNSNPDRHPFFEILERDNDRLQHLALLIRFLMLEEAGVPTKVTTKEITKFVDRYEGVDLDDFEQEQLAQDCLDMLDVLYDIFKDDEMQTSDGTVPYLNKEYFIISVYLLIRGLEKGNYAFGSEHYPEVREFLHDFYERWQKQPDDDTDVLQFRDKNQQNGDAITQRDIIIRQNFWDTNPSIAPTDEQRLFSKAQRIQIYRDQNGLCEMCLEKGKPEEEARVPWDEFDADHIVPHSEGGETSLENARLLCYSHNRAR